MPLPSSVQDDFPILASDVVYLDSAATSLTPTPVVEAMQAYYNDFNANIHRGLYDWSARATELYDGAHERLARFVGAEHAEELIFTSGTTSALNMIARMTTANARPGDEIVVSVLEHHSNMVPWQQITKERNLVLRVIDVYEDGQLNMKHAKELINERTCVVACSGVSNALGTIVPLKELGALAHEQGALFVVDGAQHIPHARVNVQDFDADFYAFSGHKMYGPTGTGGFYAKREHLLAMEPVVFGGDMISEVTLEHSTWNELPWKFEAGTPNIAGGIGLAAAADYMDSIGLETIQQHEHALLVYALEQLATLTDVTVHGPEDPSLRAGVISFGVRDVHPHDVAEILNRHNIAVRAGHHCAMPLMERLQIPGTTRASLGLHNTKDDIDALVAALKTVRATMAVS